MIPTINLEQSASAEANTMPICVIGAGTTGLLCMKALRERGLEAECFEISDRPGGLWVLDNKNEKSAAYESLRIDSSKRAMAISDYPFPVETSEFPTHQEVCSYLSGYARRFELHQLIHFRHEVLHCERLAQGYRVTIRNLGTQQQFARDFSKLVICNGHHHKPSLGNLAHLRE